MENNLNTISKTCQCLSCFDQLMVEPTAVLQNLRQLSQLLLHFITVVIVHGVQLFLQLLIYL